MKLDAGALRYLSDDDFRVLTAVEMGMRNHELVPVPLISVISGLKHGGSMKSLKTIHKHKLVHRESKRYVGYRLTSLGYDYLALRALVKRGVLGAVGRPLGEGKEADVVLVTPSEELLEEYPQVASELECWGEQPMLAMKLHRLGRTSFRAVKAKRDYLQHRKSASWIYFSRLAAIKEYAFMCALHDRGFPVPRPLGQSRHVVVMSLIDGIPLNQVSELSNAPAVANKILEVIVRFAQHGLVHCDLNEFNLLIAEDETVTVIDFPQMVSTQHPDAKQLYERDQDGVLKFFAHRYSATIEDGIVAVPFEEAVSSTYEVNAGEQKRPDRIDQLLAASGFGTQALPSTSDEAERMDDDIDDLRRDIAAMDMTTLALPSADEPVVEEHGDNGEPDKREELDEPDDQTEASLSEAQGQTETVPSEADYVPPGALIDRAKVADRVRRQRANQARRRQLAKRNVVKDAEKRKSHAEIQGSAFWG